MLVEQLTAWNDEADLLRRAEAPRTEWFPIPKRAAMAMQPLIWLLALVPILFAGVQGSWTEDAARWGLRSLKLLSVDDWSHLLDPGDAVPNGVLTYEPPLMTWVTAASIWFAGPSQPSAVIFPAALCVFLLVVITYEFASSLGGAWLGTLTALLISTHPYIQPLVQQPTAATMGLTLSLLTLWCLWNHLEPGKQWSRWLIPGGVCWGLCLMSSGPLALISAAIIVLFLATAPKGALPTRKIILPSKKNCGSDWRQWKSLVIWMAIGSLVGGWWPLMMGSLHGGQFWPVWLGMSASPHPDTRLTQDIESWLEGSKVWFRHSAALLPLLSGFVLLGVYRLYRIVVRNEDPPQRRAQHFILVWTVVSLEMWILSVMGRDYSVLQRPLWTVFLLVPLSILAAGGLVEIGERHASFGMTLAAYGFGVLVAVWRYRGGWLDAGKFSHQLALIVSLGVLFGLSLWLTLRFVKGFDSRQRWLVQGGIWVLLVAHCLWGVNFLSAGPLAISNAIEHPLLQFWSDLRTWRANQPPVKGQGGDLILISTRDPSARLNYVVQSVWPECPLKFANSWDAVPPRRTASPSRIIVTYGKREIIRPNKPGDSTVLTPIVPPRIYGQIVPQRSKPNREAGDELMFAELTAFDLQDDTSRDQD